MIYPEHSMGIRVARNLLSSGFVDMFELSSDFSMAEFKIPREWIGKTLRYTFSPVQVFSASADKSFL